LAAAMSASPPATSPFLRATPRLKSEIGLFA
jgi:hypothetical protein